LEGLEQRKFLTELFVYGCVRISPGAYSVKIYGLREYGEGEKKVRVSHVGLLSTTRVNEIIDGWILDQSLIPKDLIENAVAALELLKKNESTPSRK
jgi:hypothetical protein